MKRLKLSLASFLRKWADVLSPETLIKQNHDGQDEPEERDRAASDPQLVTRTLVDISTAVMDEYRAAQKQEHGDNEKAFWVTLAAVGGAFLYAGIAAFQYFEMRSSNQLTVRALEGTQAADVSIYTGAISPNLYVGFENTGIVPAKDFEATVKIARKSIPSDEALAKPETIHVGGLGARVITRNDFWLPKPYLLSPPELERINNSLETITVKGILRYDDGFGYIVRDSFCRTYVPFDYRNWVSCGQAIEMIAKHTNPASTVK